VSAIRPYPKGAWSPKGEVAEVLIRPIRPEDEPVIARFHATLSEHSVYLRYFHMIPLDSRIAHERLARICVPDTNRELVLVAERRDPVTEEREILAVARLSKEDQAEEAEFAVLTSDKFQRHGLGTELLRRLVEVARAEGLDRVTADILAENRQMIEICLLLGFRLHYAGNSIVKAELELRAP
jgi:acetyltransferase